MEIAIIRTWVGRNRGIFWHKQHRQGRTEMCRNRRDMLMSEAGKITPEADIGIRRF
jgi:hypothetical protein